MNLHPYKTSFREHLKTIFCMVLQTIIYSVNIILSKGERQKNHEHSFVDSRNFFNTISFDHHIVFFSFFDSFNKKSFCMFYYLSVDCLFFVIIKGAWSMEECFILLFSLISYLCNNAIISSLKTSGTAINRF